MNIRYKHLLEKYREKDVDFVLNYIMQSKNKIIYNLLDSEIPPEQFKEFVNVLHIIVGEEKNRKKYYLIYIGVAAVIAITLIFTKVFMHL